ncbi:hypothetical protein SLOPH_534 [Spraguea lophii 42_110]|uniref:Uncharacterized protein n=1 Tax=Spraguea lophii (strain 42_110) TaxID=1358809 RepID=S7XQ34_SPRLO|nr:hypothetical protein SLOPH_534 [Spraguea lophii 42_110]
MKKIDFLGMRNITHEYRREIRSEGKEEYLKYTVNFSDTQILRKNSIYANMKQTNNIRFSLTKNFDINRIPSHENYDKKSLKYITPIKRITRKKEIHRKNTLNEYFIVQNNHLKHHMFNKYLLPLLENLEDYNQEHFNPILDIFFKYSPYILLTGCIYLFKYIFNKLHHTSQDTENKSNFINNIENIHYDNNIQNVIPNCKYFIALYLTACNLSMKFWDEKFFISHFESAGLSKENMTTMEIEFLKHLKYDLEIVFKDIDYFLT